MADSTASTNLPLQLTSFVGHAREVAEVNQHLSTSRLVTLTGAAGVGKTRLALQAAADSLRARQFPAGVWLVELAPLADPTLVPQTVGSVFGLQASTGRPFTLTLCHYMRQHELLLILDNCEHLIEACAELADVLLRTCSGLRILATSREILGVAGETAMRVPSLTFPGDAERPSLDGLRAYDAIRLFEERACAARPDFRLTSANGPVVADICRRLDGMPLAIELAAARVRMLDVGDIAARLDDSFRLLTLASRTNASRHQTLRAAMDWSHDLLPDAERRLFRRLAVFAGGWSLRAAESVCAGEGIESAQVLDLLTHLVDKSLVLVEEHRDQARYRLLETTRQYATAKLSEAGESERVSRRHLEFYLGLAERAAPGLKGHDQRSWFETLQTEYDNLRAACAFAVSTDVDAAARLMWSLRWFWTNQGNLVEGLGWLHRLLEPADVMGQSSERARVLNAAGTLSWLQFDSGKTSRYFEESLAIARGAQDRWGTAYALIGMGMAKAYGGDADAARAVRPMVEEGLDLFQQLGDEWHTAFALNILGVTAYMQGSWSEGRALMEDSLARFRKLGDRQAIGLLLNDLGEIARSRGEAAQARDLHEESLEFRRAGAPSARSISIAISLVNLGNVLVRQGELGRARTLLEEGLEIYYEQDNMEGVSLALVGLAGLLAAGDKAESAARLFGAVEAPRETMGLGDRMEPSDRVDYEYYLKTARDRIAPAAFGKEWGKGRAMTLEQAIDYAHAELAGLAASHERSAPRRLVGLTTREMQVLRLLAAGLSDAEIAERLTISPRTVNTHLAAIYGKLQVKSRTAATRYALDNKLV